MGTQLLHSTKRIHVYHTVLFFSPNHIGKWSPPTCEPVGPARARYRLRRRDMGYPPTRSDDRVRIDGFHGLYLILFRAANPLYTIVELEDLLSLTKATRILTDERFLKVVTPAANTFGIPTSSILLFDIGAVNPRSGYTMVSGLVSYGENSSAQIPEKRLAPGEGKTKAALLFFSSGTTGKSKVRMNELSDTAYVDF